MPDGWKPISLNSCDEAFQKFAELQGKRWLCRGQSGKHGGSLLPSIDRQGRHGLSRREKLQLERRSIDLFRSTAHYLAQGEEAARSDDIIALLVLRHYGVPTRFLDWSVSPYIAAYFAVEALDDGEGEMWCFDLLTYNRRAPLQWCKWPQTTTDGSGAEAKFKVRHTAFAVEEPPPWFACIFYESYSGFPRQKAQHAAFTITPDFGRDHSVAISDLFGWEASACRRYVIPARLKFELRKLLREGHGIWRGSLFPDSAGAADTVRKEVFPCSCV